MNSLTLGDGRRMSRRFRFKHRWPRKGDKIWVEGEQQPNGIIILVDWFDSSVMEVTVKFHDTGVLKVIPWDDLDGNWSDSFGGTWLLHKLT